MPCSAHNYTIKMSSNAKTFYIRMLEHAKLSNFRFGATFIGATDQRENTSRKGSQQQKLLGLRKISKDFKRKKKSSGLFSPLSGRSPLEQGGGMGLGRWLA